MSPFFPTGLRCSVGGASYSAACAYALVLLFGVCVGLLALVELEAGLMPVLFLSSLVLVSLKTWAPMLFVAGFVEAGVVQWVVLLLMCVGVFVLCEWGLRVRRLFCSALLGPVSLCCAPFRALS